MKKIEDFVTNWVGDMIEENENVYSIIAGKAENDYSVSKRVDEFELIFGDFPENSEDFEEYGFASEDEFKKAAINQLYWECRWKAEEMVEEAIEKHCEENDLDISDFDKDDYISEGRAGNAGNEFYDWAITVDLNI